MAHPEPSLLLASDVTSQTVRSINAISPVFC